MDKYAKDLSIFGIVWIVVVGIGIYALLSGSGSAEAASSAHGAPLTQ